VKLNKILKSQDLNEERAKCLQRFLSVRQDMLNSNLTRAATSNVDGSDKSCQEAELLLFKEIIIDPCKFRFRVGGSTSVNFCDDDTTDSVLSHMRSWDEQVRLQVTKAKAPIFDEHQMQSRSKRPTESTSSAESVSSSSSFLYRVTDGGDGIAISKNGRGYAHVQLILDKTTETRSSSSSTCTRQNIVLMSALVNVQFDVKSPSSRLSSVLWTVTEDPFDIGSGQPSSQPTSAVSGSSEPKVVGSNPHSCDPPLPLNVVSLTG